MGIPFHEPVSKIARRISQVLFAEVTEMCRGRKPELVDNVRKGYISLRQPVSDMLRTFHHQPFVRRHSELFLEYPPEVMQPVAAHFRQFVRKLRFAVMRQHKASEGHLLVRHRLEEREEFRRVEVAGEYPDKFLMFQMPQVRVVRPVRDKRDDAAHQVLQGMGGGELAAIDFIVDVTVGIEVREDALPGVADRVVEPVDDECRVA